MKLETALWASTFFCLFFGRIFVRLVDTIQNTMFKRGNFRVNLRKIIAAFPVRLCKSLNVGNFSESVEVGLFQNSVWWLQSGFAYLAHFQVTRDWRKKNKVMCNSRIEWESAEHCTFCSLNSCLSSLLLLFCLVDCMVPYNFLLPCCVLLRIVWFFSRLSLNWIITWTG